MSNPFKKLLSKTKDLLHPNHALQQQQQQQLDKKKKRHSVDKRRSRRLSALKSGAPRGDKRISLCEFSERMMTIKEAALLRPASVRLTAEQLSSMQLSADEESSMSSDLTAEVEVEEEVMHMADVVDTPPEGDLVFTEDEVEQLRNVMKRTVFIHKLCALGDVQRVHRALCLVFGISVSQQHLDEAEEATLAQQGANCEQLVPPPKFYLDRHLQLKESDGALLETVLEKDARLKRDEPGQDTANREFPAPVRPSGTLMHTAAQFNSTDVMEYLMNANVQEKDNTKNNIDADDGVPIATLRVEDRNNATPLFMAAMADAIDAVLLILHHDAPHQVHRVDHKGNTALHYAVQRHNFSVAKHLLLFGADINAKGFTAPPLLQACADGDEKAVDFLIENGASLMRVNHTRDNILMAACGFPSLLSRLLRSIEDEKMYHQLLTHRNDRDQTLVHICAEYGLTRSLTVLAYFMCHSLAAARASEPADNADLLHKMLNAKGHRRLQLTPLHVAVMNDQLPMVRMLCMSTEVDVNAQNAAGDTALHVAVRQRKMELIELLITIGNAKKSIRNAQKNSAKRLAKAMRISLKFKPRSAEDEDSFGGNDDKDVEQSGEAVVVSVHQKDSGLKKLSNLLLGKRKDMAAKQQQMVQERRRQSEMQLREYARGRYLAMKREQESGDGDRDRNREDETRNQSNKNRLSLARDPELEEDLLVWGPHFHVGEDSIDEQHHRLVDLINLLYKHTMTKSSNWTLLYVLGAVLEYTEYHFGNEEKKMVKYNYPRMEQHMAQHREFTNKVRDVHSKFLDTVELGLTDTGAIEMDLLNFLSDWLKNHILNVDRYLAEYLAEVGASEHSDDDDDSYTETDTLSSYTDTSYLSGDEETEM